MNKKHKAKIKSPYQRVKKLFKSGQQTLVEQVESLINQKYPYRYGITKHSPSI